MLKEILEANNLKYRVYIETADGLNVLKSFETMFKKLITKKIETVGTNTMYYNINLDKKDYKIVDKWLRDRYDFTLSSYDLRDKISIYDLEKQ